MENNSSNISKLVMAFVLLIVGISLLGSVATSTQEITSKTLAGNESVDTEAAYIDNETVNETISFTVTNAPTGWKTEDCVLTSVVLRNSTGYTMVETTDYVFTTSAGTFTLKDTATNQDSANATYVDYTYCGTGYMNLSWGRSIQNLVPGFFALAILGASLMLFYSIAKSEGIM